LDKKENLDDVEQLRFQVSKITNQVTGSIKKVSKGFNSIMARLMDRFNRYSFTPQPAQLGDNHDDTIEADPHAEVKKP
jgi:hypothetical protein